jgi:hypothetical protein
MKKTLFGFSLITCLVLTSRGQSVNPADLIGTWDQNGGKHPPTMIFVDSARIAYSYKGHSGTSKKYYYLINNTNLPTILTVDYRANHRKHRNEYLIQLVDKDTLKLQVIKKRDARDHFDEEHKDRVFTLVRRK